LTDEAEKQEKEAAAAAGIASDEKPKKQTAMKKGMC